jgi:hypothetical protein
VSALPSIRVDWDSATEAHEVARHRVTARMKVDLLNCTNSFLY